MAVRRKKSLNDIAAQTSKLVQRAMERGNKERAMAIQRIGWKYMDGIQDSKSFRNMERKSDERDEKGYTKGQLSPNRLQYNAEHRKYSARTYGKYTGLAKAVGGNG